jgi:tetratricopeptide (TPR) repeat protein
MSFAAKLLEAHKFEEAVGEATRAIGREGDNPEHFVDRATAYAELGRNAEAAADFERALALDEEARVLETDFVDDAYFSALLAAARTQAIDDGARTLARYLEVLPDGRHEQDVADWQKRLRGELKSEFVKIREE